jgi:putative oxidoreductase
MNRLTPVVAGHAAFAHFLDRVRPWFLLTTRLWVSWQFLKAGWLKLTTWDVTLELFRSEYQVPLLSPALGAMCGTFGELFFPALLVLGLFTRFGALGLLAVNAMAVISYWHVLGSEGYEAALAQHVLWGYMLAVIAVCGAGAGAVSLDEKLGRP